MIEMPIPRWLSVRSFVEKAAARVDKTASKASLLLILEQKTKFSSFLHFQPIKIAIFFL